MIKTFHDLERDTAPLAATVPAPLFPESVRALDAADPQARARIEAAGARLGLSDFTLQDVEISRTVQLQAAIRLDDPLYISEYGAEISRFSEDILDRLTDLGNQKHPDLVRHHLLEILRCVRRIDPAALLHPGISARLKSLFSGAVIDRPGFTRLEMDLSAAVSACLQQLRTLKKSQQIFVDLFNRNELQFRGLTIHLLAGELRAEDERDALKSARERPDGDLFARQSLIDRQDALTRFERRLHTLTVLRQTVLLRIGQLRLEQKNIHALIDRSDETINLVIPVWKQQVLALLAAGAGESRSDLHAQLDATQRLLTQKMLSVDQESP